MTNVNYIILGALIFFISCSIFDIIKLIYDKVKYKKSLKKFYKEGYCCKECKSLIVDKTAKYCCYCGTILPVYEEHLNETK